MIIFIINESAEFSFLIKKCIYFILVKSVKCQKIVNTCYNFPEHSNVFKWLPLTNQQSKIPTTLHLVSQLTTK